MASDSELGDLARRLRDLDPGDGDDDLLLHSQPRAYHRETQNEAATALEVAQAENARLRDALGGLLERMDQYADIDEPDTPEAHDAATRIWASAANARAVLSECASKDPQ